MPTLSSEPTASKPPDNDTASEDELHTLPNKSIEFTIGPLTFTDIDLSNPQHLSIIGLLVAASIAATAYRSYIKLRQDSINKEAYLVACATFIATIDYINTRPKQTPTSIDLIFNKIMKRKLANEIELIEDHKLLRHQLKEFEDRFSGKINHQLEKAVMDLINVATKDDLDLHSLAHAVRHINLVARTLDLSPEVVHATYSVQHQLQQ